MMGVFQRRYMLWDVGEVVVCAVWVFPMVEVKLGGADW